MSPLRRSASIAAFLTVSFSSLGCGAAARGAARAATPGAIDGAIDGLAEVDPNRLRETTKHAGPGMIDGALDVLDDPVRTARLERATSSILSQSLSKGIVGAVDQITAQSLGPDTRESATLFLRAVVKDLFATIRDELPSATEQDAAVGRLSRTIAREAAFGIQDAVDIERERAHAGELDEGDGSVLLAVDDAKKTGDDIRRALLVGGAAATLLVFALIVALALSRRRRHSEVRQRDAALLLLAKAIKSTEAEPWSGALRDKLSATFRDDEAADYLRTMLRQNRDMRLDRRGHGSSLPPAEFGSPKPQPG